MKTINFLLLIGFLFSIAINSFAQEINYSCQNPAYQYLKNLKGVWDVETKDRISLGNYETNKGKSEITNLIVGCGVKESFRGTYKGKNYARESMITGKDSMEIAMAILDSEHNSFSILNGKLEHDKIIVYWYRNKEVKKLQSKYIMIMNDQNSFEFSSYLSTDFGDNWALTHERIYHRIDQ